MKQPIGYLAFEVYEDTNNYMGISEAKLPDINHLTQSISGAGIMGNVEAVFSGLIEAMTLSLNFRSPTDAAASLAAPRKHHLELRVAEEYWNPVDAEREIVADKYVLVVLPKTFSSGTVKHASTADASGEFVVYYFAAYRDGMRLWEIDPWNYRCEIDGIDYAAEIREALGR